MAEVAAMLAENAAGGGGVTVFVWTAQVAFASWVGGQDAGTVLATMPLLPGALLGCAALSAATVFRAFRDEWLAIVGRWAERHDAQRAAQDRTLIDTLQAQVKELRAEGYLSNQFAVERAVWHILFERAAKGKPYSRDVCYQQDGMKRADWDGAMRVLHEVGAMNGNRITMPAEQAWPLVLTRQNNSRQYVRTADGEWAKA